MTGPMRPPETAPNDRYRKPVALNKSAMKVVGAFYKRVESYRSVSELTSAAIALSEFMATGTPPPMRKKKEPRMARLTCGVLSTTSIKGPQPKPRTIPTYARMKHGLRPMLARNQPLRLGALQLCTYRSAKTPYGSVAMMPTMELIMADKPPRYASSFWTS